MNTDTLLPILLPFAPAATLFERFGPGLAALLGAHGVSRTFIDAEMTELGDLQLAKTHKRSVIGSMNEFAYLADVFRQSSEVVDLLDLSLRLADTPRGQLYKRHITPHDELLVRSASVS